MSRAFFGAFGKRCHMYFCLLWQKMSRNFEGRISRAQSALEQLYQNFCANSREAGGLPTRFGFQKWLSDPHRKYVNFRKKIVRSSPASYDQATAEKVWQMSAELTGLELKSPSY